MSKFTTLRATALSAGLAAGLLGLSALSSSALAENYGSQPYWSGAPNAAGPASANGRHYRHNWRSHGYPVAAQAAPTPPARPYWSGAPNAAGPAEMTYSGNGPGFVFLPFAIAAGAASGAAYGAGVY